MKKVKLEFYYALAKTLLAFVLGAGGAFIAIVPDSVAVPFKNLLLLAIVFFMAVLSFALVLVFLLIFNKIK